MKKEIALQRLSDCGVVAVIRAQSASQLQDIARSLLEGGVIGIEVTMSTPKAISGIEKLVDAFGDKVVVGVGTVLDAGTAADAIHAGAEFVFSPTTDTRVIEVTKRLGKVCVPGAYTPTEILNAWAAGADIVKVFPATTLGPGYFKDILAPMPFLKLTPTGGVDLKTTADWIKAGAVCVGAGSALVGKEALAKADWSAITATAKQFTDIVKAARAK
ncbi:MAG: bifunctional 4-hydroxy-2-oxoglutarate aldolase/2-dehydro-3-deoxy-phosphogluconate aldolase [Phycisphaerales bacterium]|nr:bifunctional 4-hydroxy-2-oxoglutarate aldolase/2-dehydro-3-deoxy-phosphogluconate aldolase [Phycisphaerales bacterium]